MKYNQWNPSNYENSMQNHDAYEKRFKEKYKQDKKLEENFKHYTQTLERINWNEPQKLRKQKEEKPIWTIADQEIEDGLWDL